MNFYKLEEGSDSKPRIPLRHELAEADTWDLGPLFETPAEWAEAFETLQRLFPEMEKFRGRVGESAETLRKCLEFEKELGLRIERLYHYASLRTAEDGSDAANLARESQLQNLLTKIGEATSFVHPEIQSIEDETFEAYLSEPALAEWLTPLRKVRRLKPHTLSTAEERLMALAGSALAGHRETFSQLTNVDMKWDPVLDEKGEERPLSQSSFSAFLVQRDPAVRRNAFHAFYREFSDHAFTLASSLAHSVRADVFEARARNYPSALEAALFPDAIPPAVYENLIQSVRANLEPLFRYYELRKRVLHLTELHHYDTYVPMVAEFERRTTFDEAIGLVCEALHPLGEEYVATLRNGLTSRWCDRYESKGKSSGAFSSSSYGNPPYILMNYKADVFSDVYTLAHEAGHSMHTWYAQRTQRFQEYHYPIFLAEVASTFNEELLTHHLLGSSDDRLFRAYVLNRQIDDIRGTVYRQTMFAEFEKAIHEMEEQGEPLTLATFREVYRSLLETYFGPDFAIDPELELECLRIPHFYNAFYVYKYATGISAAVALSERVLGGVPGATEDYLGFMRSGGSQFPLPTLQAAGVDMTSPEPVEATLRLFARRVDELAALLEE
jgi:oligoendopeptidase F